MNETHQRKPSGSAIFWSWFLLISTCVISMVPVVGFISWFTGIAAIVIVTILGIVIIGEGRTTHGVLILLAAYVAVPLFIFVAPVARSFFFMYNVDKEALPEIRIDESIEVDQRVRSLNPAELPAE